MNREGKNDGEKAKDKPKANPANIIKLVSMNTSIVNVSPPK
jgi:hypothetical protein